MAERHGGAVEDGAARAERLRRSLYRPGASDEDVQAYSAVRETGQGAAEPAGDAPAPPPEPGGPTRRTVAAAAALVVALGAGASGLQLSARGGPRTAGPTPTPRTPQPMRVLAPTTLPLTTAERAQLSRDLGNGRPAGIRSFLLTRPYPRDLPRLGRRTVLESTGAGGDAVPIVVAEPDDTPGRMTVLIAVESDARVFWTASRAGVGVFSRGGRQAGGALTSAGFDHPAGGRPDLVAVSAPIGVRWGLAVVLSGG